MSTVVVIGVGNAGRGDDGVGPAVIDALRAQGGVPGARCAHAPADLTALPDLWDGALAAVLVDATLGAGEAGTVTCLRPGDPALDAPGRFVSSHALDLAAALRLAHALGRLPAEVVVLGVEGARFDDGAPLSPPAAEGVRRAAEAVRREVERLQRLTAHAPSDV